MNALDQNSTVPFLKNEFSLLKLHETPEYHPTAWELNLQNEDSNLHHLRTTEPVTKW